MTESLSYHRAMRKNDLPLPICLHKAGNEATASETSWARPIVQSKGMRRRLSPAPLFFISCAAARLLGTLMPQQSPQLFS